MKGGLMQPSDILIMILLSTPAAKGSFFNKN